VTVHNHRAALRTPFRNYGEIGGLKGPAAPASAKRMTPDSST
jgi:hypothetical protein